MKKIGILTSGGDAPGMNPAIRAVARAGISKGMEVVGIRHGYQGLMSSEFIDLNIRSVSDIIHRGGTMLYSARSLEFKTEEGMQKAIKNCQDAGIEGIVVVGGDGSFRGARDLSLRGIPCVGIPGTIDNDIASTDYTIGFDTALNTAMEMIDRLRDTSQSHDRCSVVEVMGRGCGDLALQVGIAVGATSIIVPEVPYDIEHDIIARIHRAQMTGKRHYIIVVAEGVGGVQNIAKRIEEQTGIESRATILGHVQRGGSPTVRDRVTASKMGIHAVELLEEGIGNRVVVSVKNDITDYDIFEALQMKRSFDVELYKHAHDVSI
ncbi:MAG: 6-phosphofructokinase [Acutalibacteraceae bacterium]